MKRLALLTLAALAASPAAALAAGAERAPAFPLLSAAIRLGCRAAIRLSEKI